jgi:Flp pilus assembly protein TadB
MNQPRTRSDELSTGELMSQLSAQTSRLIRDEMRLAQAEFKETAKHAGIGAGLFSATALLAVLALATLVAAAVAALALALPVWASAVIVAVVLLAASGVAALVGKRHLGQASPTPEMTVSNVKDDIQEVKDARHAR